LVITSHYQLDLSEVGDGNVAAVPSVSRWQGDGGGSLNACAPTQYWTRLHGSLPALADAWRIRMIRGDMCECICNPLARHCYVSSQTVTYVRQTSYYERLPLLYGALPGMLHPMVVTANGLDVPNSEGYSTNMLLRIIEVAIVWNGSQG